MTQATIQIGNPDGRAERIMEEAQRNACVMLCERIVADIALRKDIEKTRKVVADNLAARVSEEKDRRAVEASAIEAMSEWLK